MHNFWLSFTKKLQVRRKKNSYFPLFRLINKFKNFFLIKKASLNDDVASFCLLQHRI